MSGAADGGASATAAAAAAPGSATCAADLVREGEWVVALTGHDGVAEIVCAEEKGYVLNWGLVGAAKGTCFEMKALSEQESMKRWAETAYKPRNDADSELRRLKQAKLAIKKQVKNRNSNDKESELKGDLFDLVKVSGVGVIPAASNEELELRRVKLLEELRSVEHSLGVSDAVATEQALEAAKSSTAAQGMSEEDLMAMKQQGTDFEEIVDKLAEHSEQFDKKTTFSKEKFKRSKARKYLRRFRIVETNSQTIGMALWQKTTETGVKVHVMRPMDYVPQILAMSNVQPGARVLVVDSVGGYVTGSVLERIGTSGRLFAGHFNTGSPEDHLLRYFNFSKEQLACKTDVNLQDLITGKDGFEKVRVNEAKVELLKRARASLEADVVAKRDSKDDNLEATEKKLREVVKSLKSMENRKGGRQKRAEALHLTLGELRACAIDSLIIVSKYEPDRVAEALLPFLGCGKPFVVYSQEMRPLGVLRRRLDSLAVNVRLSESFYREQQILPGRTHPMMNMSGRAGYLLCGTKVIPSTEANKKHWQSRREVEVTSKKSKRAKNTAS
ncbi:tRNA (adenine(58)-N(1))-methyltransferase non-catalytic subunit TRM6 (tRNA(m1A58)-methyltransferase subunit TRM6) (tRNA(m1A58)MTase subunit TRM6) [Durusdinium trenchii]|uniref:tRNA (adenine(58)-N(1))-methyltransferase non-catalytic subunit TRM6 n=1 Tax=Durusdinium trenchii TaxID=1381693 RepID=A0ABP0SII9_9DINO